MKKHNDNDAPHPRNSASFLSVLFFTYTIETFRKGHFWNFSNLYKPLDSHRSEVLGEKLERLWAHHTEECKISKKEPNIFIVLFRVFWLDILLDSCLLVLSLVPRIIQPLLLGNILSYFSPSSTISKPEAYWYIVLLVVFNLMSTIVSVQYKFSSSITAMKIRVSCATCIHRKILRKNMACQNNAMNLISNDLSRFDRTSNYVHYVWGSPLFLISILNLLYYDVGISALAGVLWFILYMILQSFFARWIGSYRNKIAKKTDVRIKLMNEILSSIKVIKMYAWEKPFGRVVENSRDVEMQIVKKVTYFKGILYSLQTFVNISAVFLALLTMLLMKEEITAPKVFKLIMYYHSFNFAITLMFPLSVTKATELHQVLKRVNDFLLQDEITESLEVAEKVEKHRILLKDFTAMWSRGSVKSNSFVDEESLLREQGRNYVLRDINLKFEDGKLYGVTGAVGTGKSSLLLAILGETLNSGSISRNGSMSYASQDPCFFPGTIRQNILFDEPLEETRYAEVIRVCGLSSDLEQLPERDKTPVGESGLCLSGGQKSRINLARAIYRDVDIYLFDDPLSSVDVSVANLLMEECLMGFLKNKCRVLVTHNVSHLRKCDRIIILNSIGIVGRTGGGKSSLIASILKLAIIKGEIVIDSKNIQDIPVNIIRSRISVIPQDPVLFSGSLRYNLDPLGNFDDHVLYQSLKEVDWASTSSDIKDLNDQILEGGSNLSIGQKQLICLARTIIRNNKIILIDEATSNMDIETDNRIQKVIRKHFMDCTVLTIAHRVSTLLDYDKLMVIESGRVEEFGSPDELLMDKKSR